ncbi:MAG: hypothetical protein R3Y64_11305 [Peptostreptococcaceae bacterium]
MLAAINKNNEAVKSVQQNTNETNNKLNSLIDINSEIEYNSYITMDNTKKYNYSKKYVAVWLLFASIGFILFFIVYRLVSDINLNFEDSLKSFIDLFSNGFVILAILPGTAFISYKILKEGEKTYEKQNRRKVN